MPKVADLIKDATASTGTGNITVSGAPLAGFFTLSSFLAVNDTFPYIIDDGVGNVEIGIGTYTAANEFSRTTVTRSTNADALVNFAAGTKTVRVDLTDVMIDRGLTDSTTCAATHTGTAIPLTARRCEVTCDNDNDLDIGTLANGIIGQRLIVSVVSLGGSTTCSFKITGTFVGITEYVFPGNPLGQSVELLYTSGGWVVLNTTTLDNETTAATSATTGTITVYPGRSRIITCTPSGALTLNASGGKRGQICTFHFTTSGTTAYTITFGTNFRKTATLSTGTTSARYFSVTFLCLDGTVWTEIARTGAQS